MALIERKAAKAQKVYCKERHEYVVPVAELDWLPTIADAPVVHGRWIKRYNEKHRQFIECSNCNFEYGLPFACKLNYCPHCGCKMDGGEKHKTN